MGSFSIPMRFTSDGQWEGTRSGLEISGSCSNNWNPMFVITQIQDAEAQLTP